MLAVDPTQPVQRRRDPRRPRAHAGPRHRPRRVHPLDGDAWAPRRAVAVATPQAVARARRRRVRRGCSSRPSASGRSRSRSPAHADTTVVVVNPGWGDAVQASKAGLLEIADVFVVNKADRDGVHETPSRPRGDARLAGTRGGGRRSSRPSRPTATASTSCGARSSRTAPTSFSPTSSSSVSRRGARRAPRHRARTAAGRGRSRVCSGTTFDELAARVAARDVDAYAAVAALLDDSGGNS